MNLRILTTTDLHGHLVPHDYITRQPTQGGGLAGVSRLIKEARAQAQATQTPVLLLDNGDTFQGTPLATHLARQKVTAEHPIIASLNHLEYDALGIGNHDLDHGMTYLREVAELLDMPLLCTNLIRADMGAVQRQALIQVDLPADALAPLTVGIMSILPAHTAKWHGHHLGPDATLEEPSIAVAKATADLRHAGADLVIVLAHMGVGHKDGKDSDMLAAQGILGAGGIDALVLGHTHRRLPSTDYATRTGVDIAKSTVCNVPAVMAGHAGSDLGIMDLELAHTAGQGWHVAAHRCTLQPNSAAIQPDPAILGFARAAHSRVVAHLDEPVARTTQELHSYFSLAAPAATQQLIAQTQYELIRDQLARTEFADLPVLTTVPAHGAGGRDGLNNYIRIPPGPVLRRHIAGLNPFVNQTIGIRITGEALREWLEHGALIFNQLARDRPHQLLTKSDIPAFQFDTIFGLNYMIDPTAPPYRRISALTFGNMPVSAEQEFILATSHFRVSGGGGYAATSPDRVVTRVKEPLNDRMIDTLRRQAPPPWGPAPAWRFVPDRGVRAVFLSHPDARECLHNIVHLRPELVGESPEGFIQIAITL